ncbi:MAG TPA: hypothetical protein DG577_06110 [Firmicutes bacterium]|jgi:hypothetical protein|nr:hypothetical protein [Bacillota bacterium]
MFPWLDLLLTGVVVWGAVTGYLAGLKRALARLLVLVGALLVSLPFADNCAVYLRPRLESIFVAGFETLAMPAGAASPLLGPWQDVLTIETTAGENLPRLIALAVNIAALCFLMLTLLTAFRLLAKPRMSVSGAWGVAAGLTGGLVTAIYFLAMAPVLVLGKAGAMLATAVGESWLASLLSPLVQALVHFLALFVL